MKIRKVRTYAIFVAFLFVVVSFSAVSDYNVHFPESGNPRSGNPKSLATSNYDQVINGSFCKFYLSTKCASTGTGNATIESDTGQLTIISAISSQPIENTYGFTNQFSNSSHIAVGDLENTSGTDTFAAKSSSNSDATSIESVTICSSNSGNFSSLGVLSYNSDSESNQTNYNLSFNVSVPVSNDVLVIFTLGYTQVANGFCQNFGVNVNGIATSGLNGTSIQIDQGVWSSIGVNYFYLNSSGNYSVNSVVSSTDGSIELLGFVISPNIICNSYGISFTESGLPSGTTWFVNLTNGESYHSSTNIIDFSEPNGSYNYAIGDTMDYYPYPESGIISVDGSYVSMNITFRGISVFDIQSQYGSFFLSNVSFKDVIGVYAFLNGSAPVSVSGCEGNNSFSFVKENKYWNATVNTGNFGNSSRIRIIANYSNNETVSKNYTLQIIKVPNWLSEMISSGLVSMATTNTEEWNNTYDISDIININFEKLFSQNISIPDLWSGSFSFIPSISLGVLFNSSGNISLFGSFTEETPTLGLGPASVSIGGTIKIVGNIEINKNLTIDWVSAALDVKVFGTASVNIPILGDTFDIGGYNISLGLSATIAVSPSFALDIFFIPSSNASRDILPNLDIAIQKIISSISVPLTVKLNLGVGVASVSGGGTIDFTIYLQNTKPFNKGGDISGELFINYNVLFWSGTIYSIGPSTLYSWGNVSGSGVDPSGNLSYMNRYFNVTGYDSFTWQNYSINGTAIHDIYPQTTISSVTYGNMTYAFYSSDNVSKPVNDSLCIRGYKFDDSSRAMTSIKMPFVPNGITLHPYAVILSNGSLLVLWSFVPENELNAKSVTNINNIMLQGAYYNTQTGKWSSVFNISSGSITESYRASVFGGDVYAAVLTQHSIFSTQQNITIYSLLGIHEVNSFNVSNVSEIDTFSKQGNSLGLSYINGSIAVVSISSNEVLSPSEPGFVLVSNGYVSGNANYEYLLFRSDSQDRILVMNFSDGSIITNLTINITSLKASFFYYHGSLFAAFSSSGYVSIYNITESRIILYFSEYEGSVYNFGVSSSGSSVLLWSLVNYGNETEPLLNLNLTELGTFYEFTIDETGLPPGTAWYANLSNGMDSGPISGTSHTFQLANGSYSYTITSSDKIYSASPSSSSFTVNGVSFSIPIAFSAVTYEVTFTESGLQSGSTWYVNLSNSMKSGSITGSSYSFSLVNGSYFYTIATSNKIYEPSTSSGTLTVNGASVSESVTFSKVVYEVTFTESGLPSGVAWYVNGSGVHGTKLSPASITFSLTNGTYTFTVTNLSYYYTTTGYFSVVINGKNVTEMVDYYHWAYITGKVSPVNATVMINGKTISLPSTGSFNFSVPSGTYYFVASSTGYKSYYYNFSLSPGSSKNLIISLKPISKPSTISSAEIYGIIGAVVAVAVIAAVVFVIRRR